VSQHPDYHPDPAVLDITDRVVQGTLVVAVVGEIDLDTAPALRAAVTDAIHRSAGEACVVDLTKVTFLGSAGLAALVEAASLAETRRKPLRIVIDSNRPVIRPIVVTGLDEVLELYHTVEEALRAGER
jgi:anti-sigma B factor antagonist